MAITLRDYQKKAVEFLTDEIRLDDTIISITAPSGIGKTIVLEKVLNNIENNKLVVCIPPMKAQYRDSFKIDEKYLTTPHELLHDKLNLDTIDYIFLSGLNFQTKQSCINYISKKNQNIKIINYN